MVAGAALGFLAAFERGVSTPSTSLPSYDTTRPSSSPPAASPAPRAAAIAPVPRRSAAAVVAVELDVVNGDVKFVAVVVAARPRPDRGV